MGSPASVSDVAASTADESPSSTNQKKDLDVLVPDLGDIDEVEVIEIGIAVGDSVSAGDLLLVLESMELSPKSYAYQHKFFVYGILHIFVGSKPQLLTDKSIS